MKIKYIVITTILFLSAIYINAQEKYDFLSIISDSYSKSISTSINGTKFVIENLEWPKGEKYNANSNPVLKKITDYQNTGWEVMSLNSVPLTKSSIDGETHFSHIAYLRRKKTETK